MQRTNFMGLNGFVWWMGVVENRKDPLKLGRCQVRIFGWHTDNKSEIPSADLPWAHPMLSLNDSETYHSPKEGDYVAGFFSDGEGGQFPIMMGVLPGIPDQAPNVGKGFSDQRTQENLKTSPRQPNSISFKVDGSGIKISERAKADVYPNRLNEPSSSRLYRNENVANTMIGIRRTSMDKQVPTADPNGLYWDEPYPAYNTTQPYNKAVETESGHVFELDDTPGSERVHLAHRTGTFTEMYPSGTKVEKVTKDNYEIIMGNDFIHVMGKVNITVDSDVNILAKGDINIIGGNDLKARIAGKIELTAGENFSIRARSFNVDVQDTTMFLSGAPITADAPAVWLNSGLSSSDNIPLAPFRAAKNNPVYVEEPIPIPNLKDIPLDQLTPDQGQALKYTTEFGVSESTSSDITVQQSIINTANVEPNLDAACIPLANLKISDAGLNLIKNSEGFSAKAYVDPATKAEPITIGYGATASDLGRPVKLGDTVTETQALQDLRTIVDKFASGVKSRLKVSCVTQGQFDAMVSLAYNIGLGNFGKSSVLSLTNINDKVGAANAFLAWNKGAGKVLPGLVIRRETEKSIYLS